MFREKMLMLLDAGVDPLEVSIMKWKGAVETIQDLEGFYTIGTCGLCEKYYGPLDDPEDVEELDNLEKIRCVGCPVSVAVGQIHCFGTPLEAMDAFVESRDMDGLLEVAKMEVNFLESLRKPTDYQI